jgi:hypothetical protein
MADITKYSTEGCLVASVGFIKGQHKSGGESGDDTFPAAIRKSLPCRATVYHWTNNLIILECEGFFLEQ